MCIRDRDSGGFPIPSGDVRADVPATSRVPITTSWPRSASLPARARPTTPVPRTATLMAIRLPRWVRYILPSAGAGRTTTTAAAAEAARPPRATGRPTSKVLRHGRPGSHRVDGGVLRHGRARRPEAGPPMTGQDWAGLVITVGLLVYLFVALVRSDRLR